MLYILYFYYGDIKYVYLINSLKKKIYILWLNLGDLFFDV